MQQLEGKAKQYGGLVCELMSISVRKVEKYERTKENSELRVQLGMDERTTNR